MDTLCSLFEAVACVGDVLGRGGEKEEELQMLVNTVESVSQSVRDFVADMDVEERNTVFHSNQVFRQLATHLQHCDGVIAKYRRTASTSEQQMESLEDQRESRPVLSAIRRGLLQSSRTLSEGLEVISGRLGSFATDLLRMPEDELAVIRRANEGIHRLLPQLTLAVSVRTFRGQRRAASSEWTNGDRPMQAPRLQALPSGDAAAGIGVGTASSSSGAASSNGGAAAGNGAASNGAAGTRNGAPGAVNGSAGAVNGGGVAANDEEAKPPLLRLQLVSDYAAARTIELPALNSQELRPFASTSSSSVDSGLGAPAEGIVRLVFGRQEVKDKVPMNFKLPTKVRGQAPQPVHLFVSRDMFLLDVPTAQPAPEPQDTMEMATLAFGVPSDEGGATLAWGGDAAAAGLPDDAPPLATISGLSSNGLHLRELGETRWRWLAKEQKAELTHGDRIALLLESPPGSCVPGPQRDLGEQEAQCLVGLEVQRP